MEKLKKYRIHKAICDVCKGNGFVKIIDREDPKEVNIHQCWECDSEGEIYVHEPQTHSISDDVSSFTDTNIKLH